MAITFVDDESVSGSGSTAVLPIPSGTTSASTLYALIGIVDNSPNPTITPPTGVGTWTLAETLEMGSPHSGSSDPVVFVYTRAGTDTEPTDEDWGTGASIGFACVCFAVDGTDGLTGTTAKATSDGNTTSIDSPSRTAAAGELAVYVTIKDTTSTLAMTAETATLMTGSVITSGGAGMVLGAAHEVIASAGATGTQNWTLTSDDAATMTLLFSVSGGAATLTGAGGSTFAAMNAGGAGELVIEGSGGSTLSSLTAGGTASTLEGNGPHVVNYIAIGGVTDTTARAVMQLTSGNSTVKAVMYAPSTSTTLTADPANGASSIDFDTTGFANSDLVVLEEGNLVSWHTLSNVTGSAADVSPVLPQDFSASTTVYRITGATEHTSTAELTTDGYGIVSWSGLSPATKYFYYPHATPPSGEDTGAGRFNTAPTPGTAHAFTVCAASCCSGDDRPVWAHVREHNPELWLGLGDNRYADQDPPYNNEDAEKIYFRSLGGNTNEGRFMRSCVPVFAVDDHEMRNDSDSTAPEVPILQAVYRKAVPSYPLPSSTSDGLYHSLKWGRYKFIVADSRTERSPKGDTDSSSKIVFSAEQFTWLESELADAKTNNLGVVLILTYPWIAAAQAGQDHWGGYPTARTQLADAVITAGVENQIMSLHGDMHALAFSALCPDYSTGAAGARWPSAGLAALHETGSSKGGPYDIGPLEGTQQYGRLDFGGETGDSLTVRIRGYEQDAVRDDGGGQTIDEVVTLTLNTDIAGSGGSTLSAMNAGGTGAVPIAGSGGGTFPGVTAGGTADSGSGDPAGISGSHAPHDSGVTGNHTAHIL